MKERCVCDAFADGDGAFSSSVGGCSVGGLVEVDVAGLHDVDGFGVGGVADVAGFALADVAHSGAYFGAGSGGGTN